MEIELKDLLQSPIAQFSQKLKKLCEPLFKQYHLNYFDYARFYPDSTTWAIFTDPSYVDFFSRHPAYRLPGPGSYIWSGYIDPGFLEHASEGFNYFHGVTLLNCTPQYIETVNLGAPAKEVSSINFYINQLPLIRTFIQYVLSEVKRDEKVISNSRIIVPQQITQQSQSFIKDDRSDKVIQEIASRMSLRKNHQLMLIGNTLVPLSLRENQCIEFLLQGYSNKEIGRLMNVSHRTIEKYFQKIYEKCDLNSRRELMSALIKS